jgi:hypothetical protein
MENTSLSVTDFIIDKPLTRNPKDIFKITRQADIAIMQSATDNAGT